MNEAPVKNSTVSNFAPEALSEKKETIRSFFDSIASRYDQINQVLSWNLDDLWRKKSLKIILSGQEQAILDLGVGTGKFLQLFLDKKTWKRSVGLDFSINMLIHAKKELPSQVQLVSADFHHIPLRENSFDLIVSSYTLRSVQDLPGFFSELHRLLQSGGKAALLCLTRPTNPFWKMMAYPYLKFFLPLVGGALSGQRDAYRFLSDSILTFQAPEETMMMLKSQGFRKASLHRFTFGLATLILAEK